MNAFVFGYGSLIWNPGFAFLRAAPALLHGAHRSLCVYSHRHRGTATTPGLVFGLTGGGACRGMAFEVDPSSWNAVRAYLDARESDNTVYRPAFRPVRLVTGETVTALAYLVNQHHPQFAGDLSLTDQLRYVRQGIGESGRNVDYVRNTATHLLTLGIRDRGLMAMVAALDSMDL